jgi:hypothetical protein
VDAQPQPPPTVTRTHASFADRDWFMRHLGGGVGHPADQSQTHLPSEDDEAMISDAEGDAGNQQTDAEMVEAEEDSASEDSKHDEMEHEDEDKEDEVEAGSDVELGYGEEPEDDSAEEEDEDVELGDEFDFSL